MKDNTIGFIILFTIIACLTAIFIIINNSIEIKTFAKQGLQQCYVEGYILWQKGCNNG